MLMPMLRNYFIIAWRNLTGNKVYSGLNIVGLAAGMAVALLIGLWVVNEYSYDRWLPGYEQVYQVELNATGQRDGVRTQSAVSLPLAADLRTDIPDIAAVAETDGFHYHDLLVGDKKFYLKGAMIGLDFLSIFQYPLLQGDRAKALQDPYSIVLAASAAQFTCSIALIIGTIIIYRQVQYAKDRPIGYSSDRLLVTDMDNDLFNHYNALRNDLIGTGLVQDVAKASSSTTNIGAYASIESWPGKPSGEQGFISGAISVSGNYFRTLGMQLAEGRDFNEGWAADTGCVVLNEAALHRIGVRHPVNQVITWNGGNPVRIIGVVKDALMESPFKAVQPLVFTHGRGGNVILYRLNAGTGNHEAIAKITPIFDHYNPSYPYTYKFVDEEYNRKFDLETLAGKLANIFAVLAIFISCLGLFGMAAYMAEQRTKEIGVRKVLGASVGRIWFMLSRDFLVLVTISALTASPIAFYFLHHWLQKYDYRITIGPAVFVIAAAAALAITLATISWQAIRAATANPVNSLRTE